MRKTTFALITGAFILWGCAENMAPETDMPQNNQDQSGCTPLYPELDVTYDKFVKGVVTKYCISCHYQGNSPGPGNFATYSGIKPYVDFFEARVISDQADMPQGNAPLPKSIRDSLNFWVQNCAPEN